MTVTPRGAVIGAVVLVAAVWFFVRGCSDDTGKAVEETVRTLVTAVQDLDEDTVRELVHEDYRDRLGHDREGAVTRALAEAQHWEGLTIELAGLDIDANPDRGTATARFRPVFHGDLDSGAVKLPKYRFDKGKKLQLSLREVDGLWLVTRTTIAFSFTDAL